MTKKNVRILTALLAGFILGTVPGVFALEITGSAPTVTGPYADVINAQLAGAWNNVLSELSNNPLVQQIDTKPEKLIQSFGTASVFVSHGATQRGYGTPKLFNLSIGLMAGGKIGADINEFGTYFENLQNDIINNGDTTLGLGASLCLQYNLNCSFLLKGLDLGIRIGYLQLPDSLIPGFSFDTFSIGLVGNYQFIKEKTLVPVLVKWRGLGVGTGVMFQTSNMNYALALDSFSQSIGSYGTLTIDPRLALQMKNFTVTVPLEATTALQLFSFLNITAGVGADFAFGKNDLNFGVDGAVNLNGLPAGIAQDQAGTFSVSGGGDMAPNVFNFKVMAGLGFKFGPVYLDIPISYYPGEKGTTGVNLGVTLGLAL